MKTSSIPQKVGASAINCSLVLLLTLPLYPLLGTEGWKLATILSFFGYNMMFRTRCIGMRCVGTYIEPPTSPLYASLYSLGFATFFYSVWFPMDLLLANGLLQITSLAMTGNTAHGNFAGQGTMSREQYLERAKNCARLICYQGDLLGAVELMDSYLNRWPDLQQPKWMIDIGRNLARDGNQGLVLTWIEGFE